MHHGNENFNCHEEQERFFFVQFKSLLFSTGHLIRPIASKPPAAPPQREVKVTCHADLAGAGAKVGCPTFADNCVRSHL